MREPGGTVLGWEIGWDDAEFVSRLSPQAWEASGLTAPVPSRGRAATAATQALADLLHPDGLRVSPLGAQWSTDVDVYVTRHPPPERLERLGWLPLDALLARLGSSGEGRWLAMDGPEPLGTVDIYATAPPDPVMSVLGRCRRRREVRIREVLELRTLHQQGHSLPPDGIVSVAARMEAALGGSVLASRIDGPPLDAPVRLAGARLRSAASVVRRRPRLSVAVSGVDGAGKSTLCRSLVDSLRRAGIPTHVVWTRPGLRLGLLEVVATFAKRGLGQDGSPGIRAIGRGDDAGTLASRRGATGWLWSLLVTASFLADVRTRHHKAEGVVVYDRHLLDALATLRVVYPGVSTAVHEKLVRWLLPRAALTFYLEVSAEESLRREAADLFSEAALLAQLDVYAAHLEDVRPLRVLDATAPVDTLAHDALSALARWRD